MTSTPPDGGRGSGSSGAGPAGEPQRADLPSTVQIADGGRATRGEPQNTEDFLKAAEAVSPAARGTGRATKDTVDAATAVAPGAEGPAPASDRYEPVRLLGTGGFGEVRLVH